MRARLWLAVGVVSIALLAGVAIAAIPDSQGVISGCYDRANGQLRVIDAEAGAVCRSNETLLTWNQTGPQGPPGPQGPQGVPGPPGPNGISVHRVANSEEVQPGEFGLVDAFCPPGEVLTGGGVSQFGGHITLEVIGPAQDTNPRQWRVTGTNNSAQPGTLIALALCTQVLAN